MTYLPDAGAPVTKVHNVPGRGRTTINIALEDTTLANAAMGFRASADRPIVRRTRAVLAAAGVVRRPRQRGRHGGGHALGPRGRTRRRIEQRSDVRAARQRRHGGGDRDDQLPAHERHAGDQDVHRAGRKPPERRGERRGRRRARVEQRTVRRADRIDAADLRRTLALLRCRRRHVGRGHERDGDQSCR